ncbi:MAG: PEPxxWA-CTERM sorting domain-containing protein [Proteobacteria bacterium]|nr:PEPxxWA-CTERM sorting domain-containing protein [Pseudomonadota bacterium]
MTINGVDFNLNALPAGGTGIVQLAGGKPDSVDIAIGEFGVTSVYSIINSAFGEAPCNIGALTFHGSAGDTFVYNLVEGDNVRDHATTAFNISAPNVFGTHDFGDGDRLDAQQIILPVAFGAETLTSVTFTAVDGGNGNPFLAALTTSSGAVPEPATWALMLAGFGGLGALLRRRRAAALVA